MQHYSHRSSGRNPFTQSCCVLPAVLEAVREKEQQRPPNGLVKVVCLPFDGAAAQKHGRKKATDARFETMIGPSSWVDSLFVWFPAAWMPLVIDALREKSYMHSKSISQLGAVAFTDRSQSEIPEAQEFSYKVKRWQVDQSGCCPVLQSRINVDWLTLTLKCSLLSSPDFTKESFMTCSYRRQRWPGTMPLAVG